MQRSLIAWIGAILIMSQTLYAQDGKTEFVEGLDHLANGNWNDAATALGKAVGADDENASYQLNYGVALTMAGNPAEARAALARAGKLDPKNGDAVVWSYARLQMYESTAFGGSPPYRKTDYAAKLIDNAIFYGSPHNPEEKDEAWTVIAQVAKDFAWRQLGKGGAGTMADRVAGLYKQDKFQECLDLINKLRAAGPIDWKMVGYSAHCKLGLGDAQGARDEYTIALRAQPAAAAYLIGRARTEIALGSLRDADADFELSRQIDPKLTEKYVEDAKKLLADARAREVKTDAGTLWSDLKQAASNNASEDELVKIADQLNRARGGQRYVRDEEYTRQLARWQIAINADPKNPGALVDMAAFLLNPTVVRKAALPNVDALARIPVGDADAGRAEPYLGDALKLDPANLRAIEQTALLYLNYKKPNDMIAWVHKALDGGALTLDLAEMHLLHYTNVADQYAAEAAALRAPTITHEERHEGDQIVTYRITTPPSAAALARAAELEKQSIELRRKAIQPMEALAGKLKDSDKSDEQITYRLANAQYYRWTGKYDASVAAAQEALKIDPYNLDALTFLIDLCPKVGMGELAVKYQDLLNNLANPSSGRTLDAIWPQMKQTRFKGAHEQLAKAEQIDPGSPHIACAAFAIAQEQNKLDAALTSGRILLAMELARVAANGRSLEDKNKDTLVASDAIIPVYVHVALAKMLDDAGRFDETLDRAGRAIRLVVRVPAGARGAALPETIKPNDPGKLGADLTGLYATANRLAAYKLLAKGDTKQAISHVVALAQMDPPDRQAMQIGYQVYQTTGFKPFQGKVPDGWRNMFEMWDRQRDLDKQFGRSRGEPVSAEIAAIDQELDRVNREIQHGVGPDDLRQLEAKREELLAKRRRLQSNSRGR